MPRATDTFESTPDCEIDPQALEGGPTGAVLKAAISAVRHDLKLQKLRSHFVEQLISSVYVVDDSNRLIGVVRDVDLLVSRRVEQPEVAAEVMSPAPWVREDRGVRPALVEMARANQRRVAVVTSDGVLIGVLDDVAGLKWLVAHR